MGKDDLSMLLTQSEPGEILAVDGEKLASLFSPGTEGAMGQQGIAAAERFAHEHNCDLSIDPANGAGSFVKRTTVALRR